jgi:hypothetical protein
VKKSLIPDDENKENTEEYPMYPEDEDIYNKFVKEKSIDPEDVTKIKESKKNDKPFSDIDEEFTNDMSGSDLDIPGSELDDDQEIVGSEDEENNLYSLGGDDHNDLDEEDENNNL